jgi:hypothetical protein
MFKISISALIIMGTLLFTAPSLHSADQFPETEIAGQYRSDTIDYDDRERTYFRERGEIRFSRESSLGFTHITLRETGEKRYTWYMKLHDISENLKLLAGNFQASSGAGLLLGRKSYISPDPFSSSLRIARNKKLLPVKSGNPLYSFYGIAAETPFRGEHLEFSLNAFTSLRNRYIGDEDLEKSATGKSLTTLFSKNDYSYGNTEPVQILDSAVMGTLRLFSNFIMEACFITTRLKGPRGNVLWDLYRYEDEERGIEDYNGYSLFFQYGDDYITLFMEYSVTETGYRSEESGRTGSWGYGFLSGIRFRHPRFAFSAAGKNTSEDFTAVYSGISPYPERSWITSASYTLIKGLKLGASVSSEKRLSPGKYQAYLPLVRREKAGIKYRRGEVFRFSVSGSRVEYTREDEDVRKYQTALSSSGRITRLLGLSFKGKYQHSSTASPSGSAGTGLSFFYDDLLRLDIKYTRYFISRENHLYDRIFHDESSISTGSFIENSLQTIEAGAGIKKGKNNLSASYQSTLTGREVIRKKFRVMGTLIF